MLAVFPVLAVSWAWKHSAWPVLLARFSFITNCLCEETGDLLSAVLIEEAISTLELVAQVLFHAPHLLPKLNLHVKVSS